MDEIGSTPQQSEFAVVESDGKWMKVEKYANLVILVAQVQVVQAVHVVQTSGNAIFNWRIVYPRIVMPTKSCTMDLMLSLI